MCCIIFRGFLVITSPSFSLLAIGFRCVHARGLGVVAGYCLY